jgi:hypothetical protein
MIQNICYHIGFTTYVPNNKLLKWFQEKQIKLQIFLDPFDVSVAYKIISLLGCSYRLEKIK